MTYGEWVRGPFGLDAQRGQTLQYQRTVLVVIHTVTAATRLGDVVPMLEQDPRVQVVYTHPPSALISGGVTEFLARLGGVVVPWRQVTQTRFDLALAASDGLLEWVHAPVVKMLHGAGYNKFPARWDGHGTAVSREAAGPQQARLICHGRTIASAIVLPTQRQVDRLRRSCPEAAAIALVAGDPCYDRLSVSLGARDAYRRALGARNRRLVVVSSTWGPGSLLNRHPDLLAKLMYQLSPRQYQVAAFIHPGVWYWHGIRQIRAWYAESVRQGLFLIPPEEGWRAALAAADIVIGDQGSATCYAASAGIPVLLASFPTEEIEPGSTVAQLADIAPNLQPEQPYAPQLEKAMSAWRPEQHRAIQALVTDIPGQSARIIRSAMYRLMQLPEPDNEPQVWPVPAPRPVVIPETFGGDW
ncbi:MAG: hypothetical protein JO345_40865 [Streptosporangiaceae bacterium]|nr:hypothetical protein [Streptosporangiaceae bacterium]